MFDEQDLPDDITEEEFNNRYGQTEYDPASEIAEIIESEVKNGKHGANPTVWKIALKAAQKALESEVALKTQLSEKEAQVKGLVEAVAEIQKTKCTTYTAKNGREVGIEQNGEMCYIVPFDVICQAEDALSTLPTTQLELYRAEKAVIEAAIKVYESVKNAPAPRGWDTLFTAYGLGDIGETVKALKEMETK